MIRNWVLRRSPEQVFATWIFCSKILSKNELNSNSFMPEKHCRQALAGLDFISSVFLVDNGIPQQIPLFIFIDHYILWFGQPGG